MLKFFLTFIAILISSTSFSQVSGTLSTTCIWSGTVADCLPADGLRLGNQRDLRLGEANANGANYVALQAPSTLAGDVTLTMPADDGDNFELLGTNGSGTLDWTLINSTSFFTSGAQATASARGVVQGGTVPSSGTGNLGDGTGTATNLSSAGTSTAGTEIDVTSSTLTLSAGIWELKYSVEVSCLTGATAGSRNIGVRVRITDPSNNALTGSDRVSYWGAVPASTVNYHNLYNSITVNVASSDQYKLRITSNLDNAGTGGSCSVFSGGITTGLTASSYFYAIKIQ